VSNYIKISLILLAGMILAGCAFADSEADYYVADSSEIVDLNAQNVIEASQAETDQVSTYASVNTAKIADELVFYHEKLFKIKAYIKQLNKKLRTAKRKRDTKRVVQLSNLIAKQYKRVKTINGEISKRRRIVIAKARSTIGKSSQNVNAVPAAN
jgi:hypothetical protein